MSVIRGGPSGWGRPDVSLARSIVSSREAKRVRISHGRSLCPSIRGVRARTLSTLAFNAASSGAALADPASTVAINAAAIIPDRMSDSPCLME